MAKWITYKGHYRINKRVTEKMLNKAMKGKLYKDIMKDLILLQVNEKHNEDSELYEYFRKHYSMYLI